MHLAETKKRKAEIEASAKDEKKRKTPQVKKRTKEDEVKKGRRKKQHPTTRQSDLIITEHRLAFISARYMLHIQNPYPSKSILLFSPPPWCLDLDQDLVTALLLSVSCSPPHLASRYLDVHAAWIKGEAKHSRQKLRQPPSTCNLLPTQARHLLTVASLLHCIFAYRRIAALLCNSGVGTSSRHESQTQDKTH